MKALTIWQPWASLIAIGAKPYEFRGWAAPRALRGQRIVIHSGVRPMRRQELQALWLRLTGREPWRTGLVADKALPLLKRVMAGLALPMGHGLGTAILGEPTKNPDLPGMPACGSSAVSNTAASVTAANRLTPSARPTRSVAGACQDGAALGVAGYGSARAAGAAASPTVWT